VLLTDYVERNARAKAPIVSAAAETFTRFEEWLRC
jgi:hypothetical protein